MNLYPLTPGQVNATQISDDFTDLNRGVLPVILSTSTPIDHQRLAAACSTTRSRHPALRIRICAEDGALKGGQYIDDPSSEGFRIACCRATVDADVTSAISSCYSEMVDQIDLLQGSVWALSCVHAESKTYLIFAINHFVCDFISIAQLIREIVQLYEGLRTVETLPRDTYIEYLNSIAQVSSTSDLSAGARWWLERPWDNELRMRGLDETRVGHYDLEHHSFEQLLTAGDIRLAEDTERQFLLAVAHSILEVSESPVVRLAVCHHGRSSATRRHAVGWMSQVIPHFLDRRGGSGTLEEQINEVERHEPDWGDALEHMRMLTPPPMIGGVHALVNYLGELPTKQRRIGTFLYEPMQPGGVVPARRRSDTPLRITVQRQGNGLSINWEYNDLLWDSALPRDIANRVSALLRDSLTVKN